MKMSSFEAYVTLGLALIAGAVAWGTFTTRLSADENGIINLQGEYATISTSLSALAIGQATIQQKVNDIDSTVKK